MEEAGENRVEQERGDAVSQSGSGRDESRGIELAEHAADGESSHTDRFVSGTGAEEAGMSTTAEAAVHVEEKDERHDSGKEILVSSQNGIRAWDQRDLQPGRQELQSTLKLGDDVEDDARAVARSLTALLGSLKSALSEVTGSSLEHMRAENEAAGQVQDVGKLSCETNQWNRKLASAIDAATKGNRFINGCLRLNEEMKGMSRLATQLESLKQRVDQFEYQSNRYLPRQ